ncbi:germination protein [Paenibacillus sp. J31TS4]|uniref:Ger(x)C family spore germination protein n=1 Tax=Paenibacillus sp. J31TS4 TaxID=2807195 RepID=UPI001B04A74B|nr:Ger(x)C family spore germination protein [Paenibacillus sp. J31TS4]GIP40570.1 germination protein [Paenibacillus sp. J31TS4]
MRHRMFRLLVAVMCLAMIAGCSRTKQLNRISFVTAIGLDKGDTGVKIHALIAVPGKFSALSPAGGGGAEEKPPNYILTSEGDTIPKALYEMKRKTSRDMNFGHTRLILFSDELAKEGVEPLLDLFMRREEFQINPWVAVTKGSTKDVLQAKPEVPQSVTDYLVDTFSQSGSDSMEILPIFLYQFYSYLNEPGKTPYAMEIRTQKEGNRLRLANLGLFRKGKLVGALTPKETKYLQMVIGDRLRPATLTIRDISYTLLALRTKHDVTKEGIKLDMSIRLDLDANPAGPPMSYSEKIEQEAAIANALQKDVESLINKLQNLKTDPAGFGEKYRTAQGGDLDAGEWVESIFPKLPVQVKVTVRIDRKGMLS